jgi:uncharacterized damage-inducible protein DinB
MSATTDPRYPVGRFVPPTEFTTESRGAAIAAIAALPAELRAATAGLDDAQLDTPYRDGGWTLRQLVHHVADSHVNAYVRHKLAICEEEPTIRPYDEKTWAETHEARTAPVEISLALLDALHARWTAFLRALPAATFARGFFHPEARQRMTLDWSIALYAWHGRHHTAHVTALRTARGW